MLPRTPTPKLMVPRTKCSCGREAEKPLFQNYFLAEQ